MVIVNVFILYLKKYSINIVCMFLNIYPTNSNQAFLNEVVSALDILA